MRLKNNARVLAALFATGCALAPAAHANGERESLEVLRQTTLNLINVLVEQGVMTREKADSVVKAAEQKAAATVAEQAKQSAQSGQVVTTGEKGRVRVSFIPDSIKNEIREQIRQEVVAQAKTERWGEPNALPDWIDRIKFEGDVRLRHQGETMGRDNAPASDYVFAGNTGAGTRATTRAADFASLAAGGLGAPIALGNTQEDRDRLRVRARLGMNAKVSEEVSAGFRFVTGSALDRVSTNQTMGNNFNKYSVFLDRAFLKYEPTEWLSISGGRIPNPWFSTDLVWDENLNFEGFAATFARRLSTDSFKPYLTVGTFPLRSDDPPVSESRWLHGAQTGFEWALSSRSRLKVGAALYNYKNMEGRVESNAAFLSGADYGRYEYGFGLRQKGNTLFRTNAALDNGSAIWGLASEFRPMNLTAVLDLAHFDPLHVIVTADYVKNLAYDKAEIFKRTGLTSAELPDGKSTGTQLKLQVGYPKIVRPHEWNASIAYRYLGSDAVLDAFSVADFGLGGTNSKGYWVGLNYGVARNTTLGVRWLSADSIDSTIPMGALSANKTQFSVDILQVDLSASF